MKRLCISITLALATSSTAFAQPAADAWPTKPVRIVVPYGPGATSDAVGRLFAEKLQARFKQPFLIDNKPGAGGTTGTAIVAQAPADGYTLLLTTSSPLVISPILDKTVTYNVEKDLVPVAMLTRMSQLLVSNPTLPPKNLKELVAYAKQNPGKLSYASNGNGSYAHMLMEMFKTATGTDLAHVPYKSAAQAETDLMGGQVTLMFDSITTGAALVKSGRLRAYGVSSAKADPVVPQQPPIAGQGVAALKDFDMMAWSGLLAPAGTPPAVLKTLSGALRDMIADPAFRKEMLARSNVLVLPEDVASMSKVIPAERRQWEAVVKAADIKLD